MIKSFAIGDRVQLIVSKSLQYTIAEVRSTESRNATGYDPPYAYRMIGGASWPHQCLEIAKIDDCDDF